MSAYYGCVKCQTHHWEGEPLYETHMFHQDKHSVRQGVNPDPRIEFMAMAKRYNLPVRDWKPQKSARIVQFENDYFTYSVEGYYPPGNVFTLSAFSKADGEKKGMMKGSAAELCAAFKRGSVIQTL
jgi:hypothetical protein